MTGSNSLQTRRTGVLLAAVATAATMGVATATPSHATAHAQAHATFYGTCSIIGTDTAHNRHSYFRGHGVCFGSLNGKPAAAHPVVEIVRQHGVISPTYFGAPAVHGASNGTGVLIFGKNYAGPRLRFQIQSSLSSFTMEGLVSGMGSGQAVPTTNGELRLETSTSGALVG
jgi:hypothetical protein